LAKPFRWWMRSDICQSKPEEEAAYYQAASHRVYLTVIRAPYLTITIESILGWWAGCGNKATGNKA